ncbi:MAG TPA: hypothetical protein VHP83_25780 [Aggregatilineaceae bacterium]|nr:hypothetical protein [Aggregatilineaceae bacterium]
MRRLRPLQRRARQRELEAINENESAPEELEAEDQQAFEPYAEVSTYDEEEMETLADMAVIQRPPEREIRPRRVHLPEIRRPQIHLARPTINLRFDMLFVVVFLVALGIFGTLLNLDRVSETGRAWWPVTIIISALLWMIIALLRRQVASFLGGAALAGVGLSLLMDTQDIANARETLLGVVLLAVGLGIVVRGFLLRGRTLA